MDELFAYKAHNRRKQHRWYIRVCTLREFLKVVIPKFDLPTPLLYNASIFNPNAGTHSSAPHLKISMGKMKS
jgi:hypothetical protein